MIEDDERGAKNEEVWDDRFEDVIELSMISELSFVFKE